MSMNITGGSAPIPDEVFYIESVCRQEPIDSLLLLYSIISSKLPPKADSSLKLNVPEKTLKPITKLKKLKFLTLLKQEDGKGDLSF